MIWQNQLREAWQHRGFGVGLLWPLGLTSRTYVAWRQRHARQNPPSRPRVPVIIVGNVVVGGAGKTPSTLALARALVAYDEQPLIISKGHGRLPCSQQHFVVNSRTPVAQSGDEAALMAQSRICPVVVTDSRAQAINWALERFPNTTVVLMDDGLQDHALAADVELILFDARGVGNRLLLPAGPLREPWPRLAWRQHTRTWHLLNIAPHESPPDLPELHSPVWVVHRSLQTRVKRLDGTVSTTLEQLREQRCQALAGIAKPAQFFAMLRAAGFDLAAKHARTDHADLRDAYSALDPQYPLLVTAKDAVKLTDWPTEWQTKTWVMELDFEFPPGLLQNLLAAVRQRRDELSSRHGQNTA